MILRISNEEGKQGKVLRLRIRRKDGGVLLNIFEAFATRNYEIII
jgi:hypothetical protein